MASVSHPQDFVHSEMPSPDDYMPVFYVGHHESKRALPISDSLVRQAQDIGYDMLTTPITTANFHSRVLALLSGHLAVLEPSNDKTPAPIIPPFSAVDSPLVPGETVSQLVGYVSPWIDLCSPDPLISNISRQVLTMEIAYAAFCGVGNVIIPGPRYYQNGRSDTFGFVQYARAIQEALGVGAYVQIAIHLPMYDTGEQHAKDTIGDLAPFSRESYELGEETTASKEPDMYSTWDAWNFLRTICGYNSRLSVALALPRQLPADSLQSRWFAEPLRLLSFKSSTFLRNKGGHPVLSKAHQNLLSRFMRLKQPPWLLLCDVAPIPPLSDYGQQIITADGFPSPSLVADASGSASPTPAEASEHIRKENQKPRTNTKDIAAHLIYIRYLQRHQPPQSTIEKFGSGYQDYLQAPLQPLTDNLESVTYEVFERDPVKYDWYEKAIAHALVDWIQQKKPTSSPSGQVVLAVAGSGRGPLVTRALRASAKTGVPVEIWAVEKNPNAFVLLQHHNDEDWGSVVNIVKSDMRAWKGPLRRTAFAEVSSSKNDNSVYGKVDILVSELLGSFADNELSPECLDGVQDVLAEQYGISIPSSYTAHLTPILAPRLHSDISNRATNDPAATQIPYVVMLHAIDYLAISVPDHPQIQQAWEFIHPLPASVLATAEARKAGGVSGGGGGSMCGGDGANEHNARFARLTFVCKDRGVVNGLAGYFEAVLYDGGEIGDKVELSTRPDAIDEKSKDMISWFPIYFPLKVRAVFIATPEHAIFESAADMAQNPLYFQDDAELEVSIWRQTDDRKVWYEWMVEAFVTIGNGKRLRVGVSDLGSSRKSGCLM